MSVFSLQLRSQKVWQSSEAIRIRKKNKKQRPGVSDDRGGDKREKSFVVTAGLNGVFARCSSAAQAAEKNKGSFDIGLMFPCFSFQLKKRVCGRKVCRPVYQVVSAVCGATSDPTMVHLKACHPGSSSARLSDEIGWMSFEQISNNSERTSRQKTAQLYPPSKNGSKPQCVATPLACVFCSCVCVLLDEMRSKCVTEGSTEGKLG